MVKDTNSNKIVAAKQGSTSFVTDNIAPKMNSFDMNLTTGILLMYFSETVDASSVVVRKFSLTSKVASYAFTNCTVTAVDSPNNSSHSTIVSMAISRTDLNEIKRATNLCTVQANCILDVKSGAVLDMFKNALVPVQVPVDVIVGDEIKPSLKSFALDMNTGVLSLSFDETVNSDSLVVAKVTVYSAANATVALNLTKASTVTKQDNHTMFITLSGPDLDTLKHMQIVTENTFAVQVAVDDDAVRDMSNNPVAATNNIKATKVTEDSTSPTLKRFTLDMDTGLLKLEFSEIMNITSLKRQLFKLLGRDVTGSKREHLQLLEDN